MFNSQAIVGLHCYSQYTAEEPEFQRYQVRDFKDGAYGNKGWGRDGIGTMKKMTGDIYELNKVNS